MQLFRFLVTIFLCFILFFVVALVLRNTFLDNATQIKKKKQSQEICLSLHLSHPRCFQKMEEEPEANPGSNSHPLPLRRPRLVPH